MRIKGRIRNQWVIILINTGSTHNFLICHTKKTQPAIRQHTWSKYKLDLQTENSSQVKESALDKGSNLLYNLSIRSANIGVSKMLYGVENRWGVGNYAVRF